MQRLSASSIVELAEARKTGILSSNDARLSSAEGFDTASKGMRNGQRNPDLVQIRNRYCRDVDFSWTPQLSQWKWICVSDEDVW